MADLLELSARIIDEGIVDEPVNRITQELSEVGDGVAVIESFSHVVVFPTNDGLVLFDTSGALTASRVVASLREWSDAPVDTIVYTHGHVDHVGGSGAFAADARQRGDRKPRVIAHAAVPARFERYGLTDGYNRTINARQFGGAAAADLALGGDARFLPADHLAPDVTFTDHLQVETGGTQLALHHGRGETDDHLWAWAPAQRAICSGDFLIWNFPNAGNPQKVQRYPTEWAAALREMVGREPELLLPAHGLPVSGRERIARVLTEVAGALEQLVADVLEMMNAGERLDTIVHSVSVAPDLLARPYLRPLYDEPEFVIHNVWRLYGGWYDGNPSHLKAAPDAVFATEVAALAGSADLLARRAREVAEGGDLRLACQLVELAVQAEPESREVHGARADIYAQRRRTESSLMAKGIYGFAARESKAFIDGSD
ncbi:MAG: MBL fold metallo-hydrolase [Actinomycetota bacterium]|nr:MBL fold metallo-hydrolase [Actinomycetota bacterium]